VKLEIYEKFDYKMSDAEVYVDFKHWREGFDQDRQKAIKKIAGKMDQVGCQAVIIANVLTDDDRFVMSQEHVGDKTIYIIPYLWSSKEGAGLNWDALRKIREIERDYGYHDE